MKPVSFLAKYDISRTLLIAFFGLGLPFINWGNASAASAQPFQILAGSELYIKGTSNVTAFTCHCQQSFDPQSYSLTFRQKENKAVFQNTQLKLETQKLDCGNRGMNRDMHQTLKAQTYPHITIRLREVHLRTAGASALGTLTTLLELTVAGKSKNLRIPIAAQELTDGVYRFTGALSINMSDFGITPPTALMGLVKVDDQINIHLDLFVQVGTSRDSLSTTQH